MRSRSNFVGSAFLVMALLAGTTVVQASGTPKPDASYAQPAKRAAASSAAERALPRFKAGYQAACDYTTFGRPRDDFAYRNEPAYHAGWKAGFAACLNRAMMQNTGKPSGQLNDIF